MLIVPLNDLPAQQVACTLAGQNIGLSIYQKSTGLYCDILLNNLPLLTGVPCQDRNRMVRDKYFGLQGDFCFVDQQGKSDPTTPGLGSRYLLYFLEPADLA